MAATPQFSARLGGNRRAGIFRLRGSRRLAPCLAATYPPGGASDITTRIYAAGVSEIIGQPVVVENKPGGGTNIAADYVARSAPDGYTLYVANFASHAVNRHLFRSLPFDPIKDFTHVAMMIRAPMFLCVKPGSPFKTA